MQRNRKTLYVREASFLQQYDPCGEHHFYEDYDVYDENEVYRLYEVTGKNIRDVAYILWVHISRI